MAFILMAWAWLSFWALIAWIACDLAITLWRRFLVRLELDAVARAHDLELREWRRSW